jgi:hypothetical protein
MGPGDQRSVGGTFLFRAVLGSLEDLGEPSATCEMCETQEIRYVHYMQHPNYSRQLGSGCVCAGRMEEDYEGAQRRELVLRNAASRRKR